MKITNKFGVPENFVRAVEFSDHKKADYSATELTDPPRLVHLINRHDAEIEVDVVDRIWLLLGKAVHYILEKSATINQLEESYITTKVCGRILSGTSDLYEDEEIDDYKVTSVWSFVFGDRIPKWEEQLNIYAYIFRSIGLKVNKINIDAILRDWSEMKAMKDKNYPQKPVRVININLWSEEAQKIYVESRIKTLIAFENTPDDDLPPCSDKERWQKVNKWAVMKENRKSAIRVFNNEEDAKTLNNTDPKFYIEFRPGEYTRCERYCLAKKFCSQYWDD